jgi:hypothetical protein
MHLDARRICPENGLRGRLNIDYFSFEVGYSLGHLKICTRKNPIPMMKICFNVTFYGVKKIAVEVIIENSGQHCLAR